MDVLLQGYDVNRPTWFYLSLLLIVSVYFRFTRLFSLRNADLCLLLAASPGLIFVGSTDSDAQFFGHAWLLAVASLFLIRLFADPYLGRRPYLGQNLNPQGMGFLCASACAFLMTQAITGALPDGTHDTVQRGAELVQLISNDPVPGVAAPAGGDGTAGGDALPSAGPAAPLLTAPFALAFEDLAARILAILAHLSVICGLWFVGRNLFADKSLGLAMATLYLLLPCTAYNVGEFNHVLPSALIVWAFVCYRKPVVSGVLLGLACGTLLFPVFLLPIWVAYYGRRDAARFAAALVCVGMVLLGSLALTSIDSNSFVQKTIGSINLALAALSGADISSGFWANVDYLSVYRLPVMVAYFVMLIVMTIWPRRRNVEVLLAQSTAAIVGTQLWYTPNGGIYLLWYLPLMLMVVFRPRLTHLRNPGDGQELDEAANVTSGAFGQAPLLPRTATHRSLQLFR